MRKQPSFAPNANPAGNDKKPGRNVPEKTKKNKRKINLRFNTALEYTKRFVYFLQQNFIERVMSDPDIHIYSRDGNLEGLNELIEEGGDVNESGFLGYTPLHYCQQT